MLASALSFGNSNLVPAVLRRRLQWCCDACGCSGSWTRKGAVLEAWIREAGMIVALSVVQTGSPPSCDAGYGGAVTRADVRVAGPARVRSWKRGSERQE